MLQRFHGKPEEDEGVDQGVDAVTPENLRENKPRESGAAHTLDLCVTQQTPHCEGHRQCAAQPQKERIILEVKTNKQTKRTKTISSFFTHK